MRVVGRDLDRLCVTMFVGVDMLKQQSFFTVQDATGRLKPAVDSNTPLLHHKVTGKVNSAIAYDLHKGSQYHITQKLRVRAFLLANQGSTLNEIKAGTGIDQKSTICARLDDLRKDGYDTPNNHGRWSIVRR